MIPPPLLPNPATVGMIYKNVDLAERRSSHTAEKYPKYMNRPYNKSKNDVVEALSNLFAFCMLCEGFTDT